MRIFALNRLNLADWSNPNSNDENKLTSSVFKAVLLYFIDAQRDLIDDTRLRTSYFGKLATQLDNDYDKDDLAEITGLVEDLNNKAVEKSTVLRHLKTKLSELNQTTQTTGEGVSISPFPKKIRDLHKGMKVDYQDSGSDTFSMEYHGMGTRSWASILSFGAFTSWEATIKEAKSEQYFPILALEEPEAHLHPNAQRTLYRQLKSIGGQKIISTHSPYIAGQAELEELRHFYKVEDQVAITQIDLSQSEDYAKAKMYIESSKGEILFSNIIVMCEGETEEYLFDSGYETELRNALKQLKEPIYANEQHRLAKRADVETENRRIDGLSKQSFIKELDNWKTKAAPIYANLILQRANRTERFPSKIQDLFIKIDDKIGVKK